MFVQLIGKLGASLDRKHDEIDYFLAQLQTR